MRNCAKPTCAGKNQWTNYASTNYIFFSNAQGQALENTIDDETNHFHINDFATTG